MYYDRDFALHTPYWHDGYGSPRSHGCVNLAPRDAQLLYRWSSPWSQRPRSSNARLLTGHLG